MVASPPIGTIAMTRSLSVNEDFFERRNLRITCTQKQLWTDFRPQASKILPRLYLSDMYTATDPITLKRLGITHVVSVVEYMWHEYPADIAHHCVPIHDNPASDIESLFDAVIAWIKRAMDAGEDSRVLVHCMWGMSRSASIVIAYLMATLGMSLDASLAHVKVRRTIVCPNSGFRKQLMMYEGKLDQRKKSSELA